MRYIPQIGSKVASPDNNWVVTAKVPESEQRHAYETWGKHRLFLTERLRISAAGSYTKELAWYLLDGHNVRQDGTTGAYDCNREVSRQYLAETYPEALAAAMVLLDEVKQQIREQAEVACVKIDKVMLGESPVAAGEAQA